MPIRKRWITLSIIVVLAIVTLWWERETVQSLEEEQIAEQRIPDSYMVNAVITRMDDQGNPKSQITTPLLEFYPKPKKKLNQKSDNDHFGSELTSPYIEFFRIQGNPWEINAEHGKVNLKGTKVVLTGDVVVNREASVVNRPSRLETEKLIVFPETEEAETDVFVKIIGENYTTTGIGMKADLKTGQAQLLSRVRGIYEPAAN